MHFLMHFCLDHFCIVLSSQRFASEFFESIFPKSPSGDQWGWDGVEMGDVHWMFLLRVQVGAIIVVCCCLFFVVGCCFLLLVVGCCWLLLVVVGCCWLLLVVCCNLFQVVEKVVHSVHQGSLSSGEARAAMLRALCVGRQNFGSG